jgi:hypothetical protein
VRVIDNRNELRHQIPASCPCCSGPIHIEETVNRSWEPNAQQGYPFVGTVTIAESEDRRTEWRSLDWWCESDREHDVGAPIAIG